MANFKKSAFEENDSYNTDENDNQNFVDQAMSGPNSDDNNNNETVDVNANPVNIVEEVKDDKDENCNKDENDVDEYSFDSVETLRGIQTDSESSDDEIATDEKGDDEKPDDDNKVDNEKADVKTIVDDKLKETVLSKIGEIVEEKDGVEQIVFKIYENEAARCPDATVTMKGHEMMEESDAEN